MALFMVLLFMYLFILNGFRVLLAPHAKRLENHFTEREVLVTNPLSLGRREGSGY